MKVRLRCCLVQLPPYRIKLIYQCLLRSRIVIVLFRSMGAIKPSGRVEGLDEDIQVFLEMSMRSAGVAFGGYLFEDEVQLPVLKVGQATCGLCRFCQLADRMTLLYRFFRPSYL
jgi:hypothetical protein